MTSRTPATSGQPANHSTTVSPGGGKTTGLGRAAWWCLAAWPALFVLVVAAAQLTFREGYEPASTAASAAFGVFAGVMLLAAPLASLTLSLVDFRRTRGWRALVPAWILLAAVTMWDVLFVREVTNWSEVNWWVFTPTVVVVIAIVAGMAWPRARTRTGS